ncbi:MAG TPA: hypothetical protein VMH05_15580 [Bryobacteraceae bacterium]|nr:hypothetical protein [Bryobacteraceae bacterium]
MIFRFLAATMGLVSLLASLPAQTRPQSMSKDSIVGRTPDGHPDLQGIWNLMTATPLERPAEFAGKATVTDAEARAFEKKDRRDVVDIGNPQFDQAQEAVGAYDSDFWDDGRQLARVHGVKRTSLIIDPPDGKLPPRTEEGKKRIAFIVESYSHYDKVQDRPISERCLSDSEVPIIPFGADDNVQIVQTPGSILILSEVIHDARIVRMNATHLPSNIRLWLGDSIGRWVGETLVVDTTNFNNQMAARGTGEKLHVIESFSRIDANTLLYKATVEDPAMFTSPWTMEYPFAATSKPIFEYACHEGNYALPDILAGARKSEGAWGAK